MDEQRRRETVRQAYRLRCGYCGVHEEEVGSELEIDHFRPRVHGGSDELGNLVYCCTTCNRFKGDYWPLSPTAHHLLHPQRDDLASHLREEPDGRLTALTERGAFHIERLHLNRPALVALRQSRRANAQIRRDLAAARQRQAELRTQIAALEEELDAVLARLNQLLSGREEL